jgi:hypothetical protein
MRTRPLRPLLMLAALAALFASPAFAQSVALKGPDGQTATYEGPLLIDVLARVGTPTGKAIHGPEMADVILVSASDGYQVAFGLAEADPGTRANRMILADRMDGAAISATDGPFKVVVEGDLRPARSARMVTAISVIRLQTAAGH